jgi:hypothetical protein
LPGCESGARSNYRHNTPSDGPSDARLPCFRGYAAVRSPLNRLASAMPYRSTSFAPGNAISSGTGSMAYGRRASILTVMKSPSSRHAVNLRRQPSVLMRALAGSVTGQSRLQRWIGRLAAPAAFLDQLGNVRVREHCVWPPQVFTSSAAASRDAVAQQS